MTASEELRRQISCIMSMRDENERAALTSDEIEDIQYTLKLAEKLNDQRGIGVCLETLLKDLER